MEKFVECERSCREMAAQTKNPRYKKELEDMGEVWERLAHAWRKGGHRKRSQLTPVTLVRRQS
jgi:hypothetical protein